MKKIYILSIIIFFAILIGFLLFKIGIINIKNNSADNNNQLDKLELFRSLPYTSWSDKSIDDNKSGIIVYNLKRSFKGYNFYTDDAKYAYLMDMNGVIVYRWKFPLIKGKWEYAELLNNGYIVAICVGKRFAKLDRHSNVMWIINIKANHDIEVLPDGTYLIPFYKPLVQYNKMKIQFCSIAHISDKGKLIDEWSTYEHLNDLQKHHKPSPLDKKIIKKEELQSLYEHQPYDYYHLNTIEVLPETSLGKNDIRFRKGNWLICLRNTSLVIILDKESKDIVWSWGPGELDFPHMPTMLNNGNILIFDNGIHRNFSRIVEINPVNRHVVWEYKANPPEKFHSKKRGSNQRLPNGNTLICESDKGHVFEITPEGEIVWEFLNPEIKNGRRKQIYRFMRIIDKDKLSFLKKINKEK